MQLTNYIYISSGGQVTFKKELFTVTSYFAQKSNLVTVTIFKKVTSYRYKLQLLFCTPQNQKKNNS